MVFSYYHRLSAINKRIYRASDGIVEITVPHCEQLHPLIPRLARALEEEEREQIELISRKTATFLSERLLLRGVSVKVLAVRPSSTWGELHGLYEPATGRFPALITLWMRTAKQKRVVAFKAFLRTLLHEFGHHLDYEHFKFPESFHTEGFYKRESSLFRQVVPSGGMIQK